MSILAVVGGQYGSEGKGVIVSKLSADATCAVRTGGPNAGHSIIHEGRVWKMRSIPCSWINPTTRLVIGPGAVLNAELLIKEADEIEAAGYHIRDRLMIDPRATLILGIDEDNETSPHEDQGIATSSLTSRIGSTGEGVGEARIRKIRRNSDNWMPAEILIPNRFLVRDTLPIVNTHALLGQVLLEGTQGYGLSLSLGRWPYVTSANCTAAQLMSDAGLGLVGEFHTLIVFRSFPIRVGGNSGHMLGELTWEQMGKIVPGVVPERTTVTNRIRRIGEFDWDLAGEAVMVNGATGQALTFADYIDPSCTGETEWHKLPRTVRAFITKMEDQLGIPVDMVGTGGPGWSVCLRPVANLYRGDTQLGQNLSRN
jgi:adenylosuccinate synthase